MIAIPPDGDDFRSRLRRDLYFAGKATLDEGTLRIPIKVVEILLDGVDLLYSEFKNEGPHEGPLDDVDVRKAQLKLQMESMKELVGGSKSRRSTHS